jgi:hypothetical protein
MTSLIAATAAFDAQRAKIVGSACRGCLQTKGTPAHLVPRSLSGCDTPECVVPMCWMHQRASSRSVARVVVGQPVERLDGNRASTGSWP